MQRLLNEKEAEQINERLHDNTLLQVCRKVWPRRREAVTSVKACVEDIFCEVAWLTDKLIDADRGTDAFSLTMELWTDASNDIANWGNQVSQMDRYLIVSAMFRIVATAFSLHYDSYYCNVLRDALLETENRKCPHPRDLYDMQEQQRQQESLFDTIIPCSEILSEWVNEYIDNPESWLTEEIELALNPPLIVKPRKSESRKADKKPNSDYSRYSFRLNVKGKKLEDLYLMLSQRDDKGKRFIDGSLQEFNEATKCLSLDKEYLKQYKPVEVDKMLFNQVFAGIETDVRIVWRADAVELWYFINTLNNYKVNGKRLLEKSGTGPGLMQIVRSRFMNGKTRKVLDERTGKEIETSEPIEYGEEAFSHYSKKNSVSDPSVLDAIIRKIAPPKDKTDKEEIEEDLNPLKYGIKPPSEAEQLGEDLRDTSHKGKFQ